MWSGLLPPGMTEDDLSEDEEEEEETVASPVPPESSGVEPGRPACPNGVPESCYNGNLAQFCNAVLTASKLNRLAQCDGSYWSKSQSMSKKFLDLQKKRSELKSIAVRREKRKRHRKGKRNKQTEDPEKNTSPSSVKVSALDTLQPYFGINDRFEPPVCQKILKKSRLEDSIDQAVQRGNVEVAEELSDKLATREMAVKITKAVSCHKYLKAKEEEEASQERQKKKKNLAWGFEAKKRWETKSNMGYM